MCVCLKVSTYWGTFVCVCVCVCCSIMSNSLQPHSFYFLCVSNILQPIRAEGVCLGEHLCVCVCYSIVSSSLQPHFFHSLCVCCSVVANLLQPHELQPAKLLSPWNSQGKNTGVGSHSLLQGIFLTQGSNCHLLHCRQIHYHLSHQGSSSTHYAAAAAAAKSLQLCPTLCDPIDGSPPGSPVPGILQARTLEWVAISFSNA